MSLTVEQRLAALEEENTQLKMCLGLARFMAPRMGQDEWGAAPKYETPSGDLNVADNIRQLRIDWAGVHEELDAHEASIVQLDDRTAPVDNSAEIASLASRVAALEARPVVVSSSSGGDVKSALAAYDIHIIPGKLAIGMEPDPDYDASLQLGGNVAAEILGVSNTRGTDGQNPGEVHKNVVSVAGNDGGLRLLQNLGWGPKGKIRTTLNRRASILAIDSMGDVCKSTEEVGATSDGGQSWYIRTSGNVVEFCTYKIGAYLRILKSSITYGSTDQAQL